MGGALVTTAMPFPLIGCNGTTPPPQTGFFTAAELSALNVLADAVLPPTTRPVGASSRR